MIDRVLPQFFRHILLVFAVLIAVGATEGVSAQKKSKSVTEQKRIVEQCKSDLEKTKREVKDLKKQKGSATERVNKLTEQMNQRTSYIAETERSHQLLTIEADDLTRQIDSLAQELEKNRRIYAEVVRVAHRNYRSNTTTTYLFSSTDISDATHRMANVRHVAEQRVELAERIMAQSQRLGVMREDLDSRLSELDSLSRSLEAEQRELERDRAEAKRAYEELSAKERETLAEQKRQEQLLKDATKELRKLTENNKVGKSFNSSTKALNLPVEGAKTEKMQTNMVKIIGKKGDAVRSIYEGKVIRIVQDNTNHSTVMIAHGSYVSVYTHLSQVRVAVNDVVKRNQTIGAIGIGVDHKGTLSAYMQFMIMNTESTKPMNVMDCFKK